MERITTAAARHHFAELLNRSAFAKERFMVTRHGKALVAIVPKEDVQLLERLRQFVSQPAVVAVLNEADHHTTSTWGSLKLELGL